MNSTSIKRQIAQIFDAVGINSFGHFIQRKALFPFIRAVNYHEINPPWIENFERQMQFYSQHFVDVNEQALTDFLDSGKWLHDKPGLMITFDDGSATHLTAAAPILEKYGFTGWFFVPSGWVIERGGVKTEKPAFIDDIEVLTHAQLKELDKKHIIGCHTYTHCRLTADVPAEKLRAETVEAKKDLEGLLGHEIKSFCWVGGEEETYNDKAAELIRDHYELAFMTNSAVVRPGTGALQLQRTNIEAEYPLWLVRFQLSGLLDILYYGKRKRVNALTA